jgi:broad specificity phosphatase PhoE
MLIYGPEGKGKTTMVSRSPKPLVFAHERGIPAGVKIDAVQGIDSFEGTLRALAEIHKDGAGEYQTIAFDTLDAFEPHVIEYVCAKHNWKGIEQPSYGKGWIEADTEWRRFIRAITAIRDKHCVTVVLVCHATIERIDDPRAPSYTAYAPKLHKRARALVMDACDVVGFLSEDLRVVTDDGGFRERTRATAAPGRFLFLEGKPAFSAKNRFGMPEKVPIPLNFNFSNLSNYWS